MDSNDDQLDSVKKSLNKIMIRVKYLKNHPDALNLTEKELEELLEKLN